MNPDHLDSTALRQFRRREVLQVGCSSLIGLGLSGLLARQAARATVAEGNAGPRKARSVILVFLPGGPSHLDTFDPKPAAPAEVRGTFRAISTSVAGIQFCEHLPLLAARMHRLAIIRSMAHALPHHDAACFIPCGIDDVPPGVGGIASRSDWPCYAAALDYLRPRSDGVPSGVALPLLLKNGPNVIAGMNAGLLGAKHDPLQVNHDPNAEDFHVDGLSLPETVLGQRFDARRSLLELVDRQGGRGGGSVEEDQFRDYRQRAMQMLSSQELAGAFAIHRERDAVRDRYGRHVYGQSLLLARRMVEAGVSVIQANLGSPTEWDTHYDNAGPLRKKLLPRLDQAVSALVDDLHERGLLESTLIVISGEFGRTPKIGDMQDGKFWPDGRGHWSNCFSAVVAGGGVTGGQVLGASDKIGAYPVTAAYHPSDLGATIYTALGVDPAATIRDRFGRPMKLNQGSPIHRLFTGQA